jgi:hypothetical protein
MFSCPECSKIFVGCPEFLKHIKYVHSYSHFNFIQSICPFQSCNTKQSTWSGFLRHVKTHGSSLDSDDIDPDLETIPVFPIQPQINLDSQSENVNEENISLDLAVKIITKLLGRFCSQLLATGVNNSTVDLVIKELEYSMSEIFNLITMLSKQFCSRNNEEFSCKIKSLLSGFKNVRSTYHRQKYFEQN